MSERTSQPQTIDYEGSHYRTDFWEGQGREYEDLCERAALRRLIPNTGNIIMEAGAGFGRLASLYDGYRTIILTDYSLSLLQEARQQWRHDSRFIFVAANIYELPFVDNLLDTIVMIRVMHHLQMPHSALNELARVLQGGKTFVMEYANKRNLKSVARFTLRRQAWNPFERNPYEFVALNYDFHPAWINERLEEAGFNREYELAISLFRQDTVKRTVPTSWLVKLDGAVARPGAFIKLSPSIIVRSRKNADAMLTEGFFCCPNCSGNSMIETEQVMKCSRCSSRWAIIDGIYDFRKSIV